MVRPVPSGGLDSLGGLVFQKGSAVNGREEQKEPTTRMDYFKLSGAVLLVVLGISGWAIQWQTRVEATFSAHSAQIEALKDMVINERVVMQQSRAEITSELRLLRAEIRQAFREQIQECRPGGV